MLKFLQFLTVLLLALTVTIAPVRFAIKPNGSLTIELPMALAKDGDDGEGDDGEGDDGEGDDGDDGDDSEGDDGEGDDGDDSEGDDGEGDDGDDGDDSDEDDAEDDEGEDDDEDDDEDGEVDDDNDDETNRASPSNRSVSPDGGSYKPSGAISRIEVSSSGIKIRYANGAREEIENGRYRVRDENGRRVVQRRATGPDVVRLRALSERVSIQSVVGRRQPGSAIEGVVTQRNSVTITYANGWTETLQRNSYTLKDPYGRTVVMRPATGQDKRRLGRIAQQNR